MRLGFLVFIGLWGHVFLMAQPVNFFMSGQCNILPNTNVTVVGSVTLSGGALFDNNGALNITEDFINNSSSSGFGISNSGVVALIGDTQTIKGSIATDFPALVAAGTGNKALVYNATVKDSLALNNRVINVGNNRLTLSNSLVTSLSRTTGFIYTDPNGRLYRSTNSTGAYLFPLGNIIGGQYRPLQITPLSNSLNAYEATLRNKNATIDGYTTAGLDTGLCAVNTNFYHVVNRVVGISNADLTVYYNAGPDGYYNSLAYWNTNKWTPKLPAANVITPLSGVTVTAFGMFNTQPVILGGSGPKPTLTLNGPVNACSGTPVTIKPNGVYSSYVWSDNSNLDSLVIYQSGNYYVSVTDANGCSGVSDTINVNFSQPAPASNVLTAGFCANQSVTLSVTQNYTSYLWSNNQTGQSINVNTAGSYNVTVTDANGCTGALTTPIVVSANTATLAPLQSSATTGLCLADSITLTATGNFTSYVWSNGANTSSTKIYTSGTYSVTVTDANGCTATDDTTINRTTVPQPNSGFSYTISGNTVNLVNSSTDADTYLWDFGGGATSTSTNPSYTFNGSGSFTICLRASNNCASDTFCRSVVISSTGYIEAGMFLVYPNPFTGSIFIKATSATSAKQITLTNALGQIVVQFEPSDFAQTQELKVPGVPAGFYILHIAMGNGETATYKLYHQSNK